MPAQGEESDRLGGHDLPDGAADPRTVVVWDVERSPLPEPGCDHDGCCGLKPTYRVGCRGLQLIKHGAGVCVGLTEEVGANPSVDLLIVWEVPFGHRDHRPTGGKMDASSCLAAA
jgi:hypothetical protein